MGNYSESRGFVVPLELVDQVPGKIMLVRSESWSAWEKALEGGIKANNVRLSSLLTLPSPLPADDGTRIEIALDRTDIPLLDSRAVDLRRRGITMVVDLSKDGAMEAIRAAGEGSLAVILLPEAISDETCRLLGVAATHYFHSTGLEEPVEPLHRLVRENLTGKPHNLVEALLHRGPLWVTPEGKVTITEGLAKRDRFLGDLANPNDWPQSDLAKSLDNFKVRIFEESLLCASCTEYPLCGGLAYFLEERCPDPWRESCTILSEAMAKLRTDLNVVGGQGREGRSPSPRPGSGGPRPPQGGSRGQNRRPAQQQGRPQGGSPRPGGNTGGRPQIVPGNRARLGGLARLTLSSCDLPQESHPNDEVLTFIKTLKDEPVTGLELEPPSPQMDMFLPPLGTYAKVCQDQGLKDVRIIWKVEGASPDLATQFPANAEVILEMAGASSEEVEALAAALTAAGKPYHLRSTLVTSELELLKERKELVGRLAPKSWNLHYPEVVRWQDLPSYRSIQETLQGLWPLNVDPCPLSLTNMPPCQLPSGAPWARTEGPKARDDSSRRGPLRIYLSQNRYLSSCTPCTYMGACPGATPNALNLHGSYDFMIVAPQEPPKAMGE